MNTSIGSVAHHMILWQQFDFLSVVKDFGTAERVLLDGLDNPKVSAEIRRFQQKEIADFRKRREEKSDHG